MKPLMGAVVLCAATMPSSLAAQNAVPPPRISVTGHGSVFTPPDRATISYRLHGEGATSDEAVAAMEKKRVAVESGLRRLVDEPAQGSQVRVREVRSRECTASSYGAPALNTGACAIIGYVADLDVTIRTGKVDKAATAAGLVGRLGGSDPRIGGYTLADPRPAQHRATAAALADAKARAQAIAEGSGVKLGAIYFVSDSSDGPTPREMIDTTGRADAMPPPPPPPPPPPVAIDARPQPIETTAQASVIYLIAP